MLKKLIYKKQHRIIIDYSAVLKNNAEHSHDLLSVQQTWVQFGSNASAYNPSFCRNRQKVRSGDYLRIMRLRQIWAEGTFAVLKREHKLNKIQKRWLQKATEECLLSATARLVKTM